MIKVDKVNEYVNTLMANLSFKADYQSFLKKKGEKARLLIVEGSTDESFIKKIINPDVACMIAKKAFFKHSLFGMEKEEDSLNNKSAIVQLIYGLSRMPQLISCKGSENWIVYGMIDLDFDEEDSNLYRGLNQLFITDTHDLETLLLSTDNDLLHRIKKCVISDTDIKQAFSISYQIGLVRSILIEGAYGINLSPVSSGNRVVDYNVFIDDNGRLSLRKFMEYVQKNGDSKISAKKMDSIITKLAKDKRIKKYFDKDFVWVQPADNFDYSSYKDFWNVVNGHDILALLKHVNKDIAKTYEGNTMSLDREFEFDLIDNYEYSRLNKTEMYRNMYSNQVVKDIQ